MMEGVGLIVFNSVDGSRCHSISLADGASNRDPAVARRSMAAENDLRASGPETPSGVRPDAGITIPGSFISRW